MLEFFKRKSLKEILKEMGPALVILLTTLVISTFITEFAFNFGLKSLWKTLLRFLRLSLLLSLPIFLLPGICSVMERVLNRGKRHLIQAQEERDTAIHPLKNWIFRPFQGIGLSMLLASKLLTFLEIYTGSRVTVDAILPQGKFDPGRFFSSIAIGIVVSLLLSCLWTLDDLGVRHYNRKTQEVRMIGKYVGLLLPILFGFYGIITLFEGNSRFLAAQYIAQMVVVLYPPFVVFNVLHARYLARNESFILKRLKAAPGAPLMDRKEASISKA